MFYVHAKPTIFGLIIDNLSSFKIDDFAKSEIIIHPLKHVKYCQKWLWNMVNNKSLKNSRDYQILLTYFNLIKKPVYTYSFSLFMEDIPDTNSSIPASRGNQLSLGMKSYTVHRAPVTQTASCNMT